MAARALTGLAVLVGMGLVVASCKSAQVAGRGQNGGGPGGGAGGSGAGGLGINPVPPPGSGGVGGTPGIAGDPTPDDCDANGACKDGFLCTVANKCAPIGPACSEQITCQGDTYCCDATCRRDGLDQAVCIPAYVPPGVACKGNIDIGVFSPQVQCEWTDDTSSFVASSPVVADLPNDQGSGEIVFVSFGASMDAANTGMTTGVVRIVRGNDCQLLETISEPAVRANTTPALADLDNDGTVEIVALKADGKPVAWKWNGSAYAPFWSAATGPAALAQQMWSGISIHNLDEDTIPEVLVGGASAGAIHTYNGSTGQEIGEPMPVGTVFNGHIPIVGDFDADGTIELLTNWQSGIFMTKWMPGVGWARVFSGQMGTHVAPYLVASQFAVADFGTAMPGGGFDATKLDGIAEIVTSEAEVAGKVTIWTLTGQMVMEVNTVKDPNSNAIAEGGGPPVVADFDNDGFPEVGVAGATRFRVFDLGCRDGGAGCEAPFVRWSQPSQDSSSRQTGASVFDFDGDGNAEAVYADECFLRVYSGTNGNVLYSTHRTSGTWFENPVIADVDRDEHAEIVINSAYHNACPSNATPGQPYVDPIHPGVRCMTNEDCVLGTTCDAGFCRCTGDNQCDGGLTCQPPLAGMGGKVCRATHPNPDPRTTTVKGGIRVVNDRLDRWASSLPIWNQHAFSITNVRPNGQVPKASEWVRNWSVAKKGYNSFRQNAQGEAGVDDLADVTGKLDRGSLCRVRGNVVTLSAKVCNRGRRAVGSKLPATFYDSMGKVLCVSYTTDPVQGNNDCKQVTCDVDRTMVQGIVRMVVNDDGMGGRTTLECRAENNTDEIEIRPGDCRID